MDQLEPILILAQSYNQFKAGASWLWDNKYFSIKQPVRIEYTFQLSGHKGLSLFIMDGAECAEFAMELARTGFILRNRIFDMRDLRNTQELQFQITERILCPPQPQLKLTKLK